MTILNVTICPQKTDSACCGPCCLKLLGDYYEVKNKKGVAYSKHSLIALANTDRDYGTSFRDMNRVLKLMGLKRERCINFVHIIESLKNEAPVLALIDDFLSEDPGDQHYVVITGFDFESENFIVSDPYSGTLELSYFELKELLDAADFWAWKIYLDSNANNA